jgi:hypothetical protein
MDRPTEIDLEVIEEREMSVLVTDGDTKVFLPKSQIEIVDSPNPNLTTIVMPEWLAKEKGLI